MTHGYRRVFTRCFLGLISALPLAGHRCGAEDVFDPYHVYVDQEGITARCGPGGEYYRTDPLRHGQRLEVYLETEDGWLGVRPPEGSFCWVPADAVKLDRGESSGLIVEEATLAWIGTHLGKARKYLWQIQMPRGEEVTILGRAEREGPDGPQLWYRIVPPSGEFRWVHRDQVVDNPELLLREKPSREVRLAQGSPTPLDPSPLGDDEPTSSRRAQRRTPPSVLQAASLAANDERAGAADPVQLHALSAPDAIPMVAAPAAGAAATDAMPANALAADQYVANPPDASDTQPGPYPYSGSPLLTSQPIGSGVAAGAQPPLMAITSQPSVRPIGAVVDETTTVQASTGHDAVDGGWVRGLGRAGRGDVPQGITPPGAVRPTDHQTPSLAGGAAPLASDAASHLATDKAIPATANGASHAGQSVDALQLELTRRMVASSRAVELEPLRLAAEEIARNHASESERQRAGLLAQRVAQVQSVARRRDGEDEPSRPSAGVADASTAPAGQASSAVVGPASTEVTGYLVQVYSARPDSPPFALTDASGRTTFYVSPSPGVNLRRYLNQHITIGGQSGYETGLDTPHIIASGAVRSPELR